MRSRSKKIFCLALGAIFLALSSPLEGQQPKKVPRIGFLAPTLQQHYVEAFQQGLRELGYVEGQNITIEYRFADGKFERLPDLAAELVRLKVDVIVAAVTQASLAAKNATGTIPVMMVAVANPVDSGLVGSLARPEGNITGTSAMTDEVVGKQLELLKETFPKISRVAAIWNPANPVFQALQVRATKVAAQALGVQLQMLNVKKPEEIANAFSAAVRGKAEAVTVGSHVMFVQNRTRIVELAAKYRLSAMYIRSEFVEAGGFMSYGPDNTDLYRQAAIYVDKILKGIKPSDLPVEQPTKFELVINLKTAKTLGLEIPSNVLMWADRVIE